MNTQSQNAHTPGPWTIIPAHQAMNPWIVGSADGDSIADCGPGSPFTTSDQATANARLIAAAPDLLIKGKHLAVKLAETYRAAGASPKECQALREWMEAVARAEGRSA